MRMEGELEQNYYKEKIKSNEKDIKRIKNGKEEK